MNQLITIAGGVIGVYAIFALITSHVGEWIGNLRNMRAKTLFDGIDALLSATKQPANAAVQAAGKTLTYYLYAHPLISNLGTEGKPSYIAARTFTLSLIGSLRNYTVTNDAAGKPILPSIDASGAELLADLETRIAALDPGDPLRESLTLVLEGVQGATKSYDAALSGIDAWYESQMDRISGNYKRWTGAWQAAIAVVIVVAFNVDTIAMVHQFMQSSATADAIAQLALGTNQGNTASTALLQDLAKAGLPIGWTQWPPVPDTTWLMKAAGLLISAFAVMLGAPFWFDLLKKIVPVRMTGTKPAASGKQASKDAQSRNTAA
jgi:hypothetical protein